MNSIPLPSLPGYAVKSIGPTQSLEEVPSDCKVMVAIHNLVVSFGLFPGLFVQLRVFPTNVKPLEVPSQEAEVGSVGVAGSPSTAYHL